LLYDTDTVGRYDATTTKGESLKKEETMNESVFFFISDDASFILLGYVGTN
jgi:hypothetical protein